MTDVGAPSKLLDRDIFAPSPEKNENRRPRRNSESSTIDIKESERRRRERKAREQDLGKKDARPSRHRKPNHQVDLIDKLDVTGIYGPGSESRRLANCSLSVLTYLQCSITMVLLMHAILTAIARASNKHPCKPFPKVLPTMCSAEAVP